MDYANGPRLSLSDYLDRRVAEPLELGTEEANGQLLCTGRLTKRAADELDADLAQWVGRNGERLVVERDQFVADKRLQLLAVDRDGQPIADRAGPLSLARPDEWAALDASYRQRAIDELDAQVIGR